MIAMQDNPKAFMIHCPGCDASHYIPVEGPHAWQWDGDEKAPTFSPSILNRYPDGRRCHSFFRNGKWEFLSDCSHALAGKVVAPTRKMSPEEAEKVVALLARGARG